MDINAKHIRLQFDSLIIQKTSGGWSVSRDGRIAVQNATWEEAFDSLTIPERVRCHVFADQLC